VTISLDEGALFAGRYRIVRRLAAGGMGAVYEAVHVETERRRALKVMHPHLFQSAEMRERFKQEARIAAHVESEHIVDVSDAGVDEATQMPFLVMELLRGEELSKRLKRLKRLPPGEVITYLQQTALALDRTHASSIVHRDLKPDNLFLTQREDGSPRIKILDFGIAKLVREGTSGSTQSMGTPLYMAPEQYRAGSKLTAAADIYALGMMAYTLLVGEPYWKRDLRGAGDVIAFALVAIQGPQEPASQRAASRGATLPAAFDAWFSRATAVDPARRFARASEAVQALAEALLPGVAPAGPAREAIEAHAVTMGTSPPSSVTTGPAAATDPHARPSSPTEDVSAHAVEDLATRLTPVKTSNTTAAASLTVAPRRRSFVPAVVGAGAVAVGVALGIGLWLLQRSNAQGPSPASAAPANEPVPTAPVMAGVPVGAPSSTPAGPAVVVSPATAAVTNAVSAAPPATTGEPPRPPAASAVSAPKAPRAGPPGAPPGEPSSAPKASSTKSKVVPLIGRD
jgi:serine/threonine-protein kinase